MTQSGNAPIFSKMGIAMATLMMAAVLSLGACNTVEGVGEDTESAGEAIQDAAN
jgi:predicted small secreted protein